MVSDLVGSASSEATANLLPNKQSDKFDEGKKKKQKEKLSYAAV